MRSDCKIGHIAHNYLNKPIKSLMPYVGNFTIHNFRRTMRTLLGKLGVDRFVAEQCLSHKIPDMEGVYDTGDYFAEHKDAFAKWSKFLESCERGETWNVRPIRKVL